MEKPINLVPIKFIVNSTMKAKLKATAALNDMTIGDMFMDAVLEKYPFLVTKVVEEDKLQKQLDEISQELKRTSNIKANINRWERLKNGKKED